MIINRLSNETSPYLQQHTKSTVNLGFWERKSLEKVKESNLLSISYLIYRGIMRCCMNYLKNSKPLIL
ncbi:thioredoxin domain-containing protein [Gammaproteobacteria bacterium]|nr:thioredoxin domain-containing protein [Gammaproteobacteria bacterium]